jgi:hypothetical protein
MTRLLDPSETRIGVAGDWHGDTRWARTYIAQLAEHEVRSLFHLGDFGIWPGPRGRLFISDLNSACIKHRTHLHHPGNHDDYDQIEELPILDDGLAWLTDHIAVIPRGHRWTMGTEPSSHSAAHPHSPTRNESSASLGGQQKPSPKPTSSAPSPVATPTSCSPTTHPTKAVVFDDVTPCEGADVGEVPAAVLVDDPVAQAPVVRPAVSSAIAVGVTACRPVVAVPVAVDDLGAPCRSTGRRSSCNRRHKRCSWRCRSSSTWPRS